jgi:hypothetical protein
MPAFVRALVGAGMCVAGVAGFAPAPAAPQRGMQLRMQMVTLPPQLPAVPAHQVGASVVGGMMSRWVGGRLTF